MTGERHSIVDTPHGSPEAGEVKEYRMCTDTRCTDGTPVPFSPTFHKHLIGTDDAWESDLTPNSTLGDERLDGQDPREYEDPAYRI